MLNSVAVRSPLFLMPESKKIRLPGVRSDVGNVVSVGVRSGPAMAWAGDAANMIVKPETADMSDFRTGYLIFLGGGNYGVAGIWRQEILVTGVLYGHLVPAWQIAGRN
ncbi:hypothetical protein [Acrocarpospora corrugata]|uniref:hypothetical protein n=1 Tax=Acrocarpospora corrugata TaxID=35763 RepID=UPI0012D336C1|nr:hypothetical protein [Acrocarpospora corrugata]